MDTSQPQTQQDPPAEWAQHENISEAAQKAATELLEETGSPELAKHAIDQAARRVANEPNGQRQQANRDHFARELGFRTYDDLVSASPAINADDKHRWHVTQVTRDQQQFWTAWNEQELATRGQFASEQEAAESITSAPGSRTNGARRGR